jgi:hypothetical protein
MSINDTGAVAFTASLPGSNSRVFVGSGGASALLIDDSTVTVPAMNNAGTVAYLNSNTQTMMIQKGTQTYSLPGTPLNASSWLAGCVPDINDLGFVAYPATVDGTQKIVISDGISSATFIDGSQFKGGLTSGNIFDGGIAECAINNQGRVAFTAFTDSTISSYAIFTGANSSTDRVVGLGDNIDGAAIVSLVFSRDCLNNEGQIAFAARLSDGTQGVWVGTPVPEPSTLVLFCVSTIGLLAFAWRRWKVAI